MRVASQPELHSDFLLAEFRMEKDNSLAAKCCFNEEKWGVLSRSKSVDQMSGQVLCTTCGDRVEGQDALVYVCCV